MLNESVLDIAALREWAKRDTREPLTGLVQALEPFYGSYAQIQNGQALATIYNYQRRALKSVTFNKGIIADIYSGRLALSLLQGILTSERIPDPSSIRQLETALPNLRSLQVFFANNEHSEAAKALGILIQEIGQFYPPPLGPASPAPAAPPPDLDGGP